MAREDPYFRLRIPESLKDQVEQASVANKRSMTAEIIARLEASFASTGNGPDAEATALRADMQEVHSTMHLMMQALATSKDKAFDPIRDALKNMDDAGKNAAVQWERGRGETFE